MPLKERVYNCSNCGIKGQDRDLNASLNLENYHTIQAVGLTALRSVEEVLPTVSSEADNQHHASLSSFE